VSQSPKGRVLARAEPAMSRLAGEISSCTRCPRLVAWRQQIAAERRAAFANEVYWGRPVPGFGDPAAIILILGLAPAAHGANRTGRMFTGDRSGDFLFGALWRTGFASQPLSVARDDGLTLRGAFVSAAVRCAPPGNRPTPQERDACMEWSLRELQLLAGVRLVVCLGAFAWQAAWRLRARAHLGAPQRRRRAAPRFGHGAEVDGQGEGTGAMFAMLGCFHPSQQNTFTGRLTEPMIDAVMLRARELAGLEGPADRRSR